MQRFENAMSNLNSGDYKNMQAGMSDAEKGQFSAAMTDGKTAYSEGEIQRFGQSVMSGNNSTTTTNITTTNAANNNTSQDDPNNPNTNTNSSSNDPNSSSNNSNNNNAPASAQKGQTLMGSLAGMAEQYMGGNKAGLFAGANAPNSNAPNGASGPDVKDPSMANVDANTRQAMNNQMSADPMATAPTASNNPSSQ